jgi:hypothetical protein
MMKLLISAALLAWEIADGGAVEARSLKMKMGMYLS